MNVIANPVTVTPKTEVDFLYYPLMTIYISCIVYMCPLDGEPKCSDFCCPDFDRILLFQAVQTSL